LILVQERRVYQLEVEVSGRAKVQVVVCGVASEEVEAEVPVCCNFRTSRDMQIKAGIRTQCNGVLVLTIHSASTAADLIWRLLSLTIDFGSSSTALQSS
jgi:hypothetical protein